jgi:hypothetical protein
LTALVSLDNRKLGDAFLSYWKGIVKNFENYFTIAGFLPTHEVREDVEN